MPRVPELPRQVADALFPSPFHSLFMEGVNIMRTKRQAILTDGIQQVLISLPAGGIRLRLQVGASGRTLIASFEEGSNQSSTALQMLVAGLARLRIDPVLDRAHPFDVYCPGLVRRD
jgi:hypothetical protein